MELKMHLVFSGNCEEAFSVYKEIFKGEIVFIFRKKEDKTVLVDEDEKDKISHIVLNTEHFTLQGEDADKGTPVTTGSNKLVLLFEELTELQRVFRALSEDGTIVEPQKRTFFSESIGEVIDKFGVRWLIMMTDKDYEG